MKRICEHAKRCAVADCCCVSKPMETSRIDIQCGYAEKTFQSQMVKLLEIQDGGQKQNDRATN